MWALFSPLRKYFSRRVDQQLNGPVSIPRERPFLAGNHIYEQCGERRPLAKSLTLDQAGDWTQYLLVGSLRSYQLRWDPYPRTVCRKKTCRLKYNPRPGRRLNLVPSWLAVWDLTNCVGNPVHERRGERRSAKVQLSTRTRVNPETSCARLFKDRLSLILD